MATSFKNPNIIVGVVGTSLPLLNKAVSLVKAGWVQASNLNGHLSTMGWCLQATSTQCWVLTKGIVMIVAHGWDIGNDLYLSADGNITNILITTNIQQKIGYVLDTNTIWFDPDQFIFKWS